MKGDGWIIDAMVRKCKGEVTAPSDAADCSAISSFLGRPVSYWVELDRSAADLGRKELIAENARLRFIARAAARYVAGMPRRDPDVSCLDELMAALASMGFMDSHS